MLYFPVFMDSSRIRALVVGGGTVAAAKIETLAGHGAQVKVVAREVREGVRHLAERHALEIEERLFREADLEGRTLAVVTVDDERTSRVIADQARARGIPVNVVDQPERCDFIFPAMIRRGPLQVAISSGGLSPVLARMLKQRIEQLLPAGLEGLAAFIGERSDLVRERLPEVQPRRLFWERLIMGPVAEALEKGDRARAEAGFSEALARAHVRPVGEVSVVHVPEDLAQLTLRDVRCIAQADRVVHDPDVPLRVIERFARRDALKQGVAGGRKREEMARAACERGERVVVLGCGAIG